MDYISTNRANFKEVAEVRDLPVVRSSERTDRRAAVRTAAREDPEEQRPGECCEDDDSLGEAGAASSTNVQVFLRHGDVQKC